MLSLLDPLLPPLVASLSSRHSPVVELSLRIFSRLVQLPLQGGSRNVMPACFGVLTLNSIY